MARRPSRPRPWSDQELARFLSVCRGTRLAATLLELLAELAALRLQNRQLRGRA